MAILDKKTLTGFFGLPAGTKLYNWLNPCCEEFCEDVNSCISGVVITLDPTDSVVLAPNSRKTTVQFNAPLSANITYNIASRASSRLGDQLILCLAVDPASAGITVYLDSNFYLTGCGSVRTNFSVANGERRVLAFIFDGTFFVNTNDNC